MPPGAQDFWWRLIAAGCPSPIQHSPAFPGRQSLDEGDRIPLKLQCLHFAFCILHLAISASSAFFF
jgi:hypothetical protein